MDNKMNANKSYVLSYCLSEIIRISYTWLTSCTLMASLLVSVGQSVHVGVVDQGVVAISPGELLRNLKLVYIQVTGAFLFKKCEVNIKYKSI